MQKLWKGVAYGLSLSAILRGMVQSTVGWGWALPHQPLIKKMPCGSSGGIFPVEASSSQTLTSLQTTEESRGEMSLSGLGALLKSRL